MINLLDVGNDTKFVIPSNAHNFGTIRLLIQQAALRSPSCPTLLAVTP